MAGKIVSYKDWKEQKDDLLKVDATEKKKNTSIITKLLGDKDTAKNTAKKSSTAASTNKSGVISDVLRYNALTGPTRNGLVAGGPVVPERTAIEQQTGSFVDSLIGGRNIGTQQAGSGKLLSGMGAEARGKATIGSGLQETNFAAGLLSNTPNLNAGRQLPAIETSTTGRGSAGIGSTLPQNNYAASVVTRNNGPQAAVEDLEGNDLVNFLANTGNLTQTQNAGTIGGKSFLEMNRENNEAGLNPRFNAALNNPAFVNARQKREGYDFPETEPKKLNAWEIYSGTPDDMKSTVAGSLINRDNAQKLIEETWNSDLEGLADEHDKWNSVLQSATDANAKTAQTQDSMWDNFTSQKIRNMKLIPKNLTERPEDYNDHPEEYDRELYDAYYGQGEHDKIMYGINSTREEKIQLMENLKELWRDVDNGNMARAAEILRQLKSNSSVYDQNEAYKRYAQEQLDNVRRKEAEQADYMDLMLKYGNNITNPKFVAAYDMGGRNPYSMNDMERGVQTDDVHRIYSFLGGGNEYDEWAKYSETDGQARVSNEYSYAMLMTGKERDIFMDKYNEAMAEGREPEEAKAFLQGLQNSLQSRYEPIEKVMIAEGAKKVPISSSIASIMMDQANTWLDIPRHIANALGDKSTESGSSWWYKPAKTSETIKESVSDLITDKIGKVGGKTYLSLMNSLSNVVRGLTTPGSTKLAKSILGLGGFFLQVDQQQTAKYIDQYGYEKARNMAAVDAAFEVAEEFLPYETMLGSVGKNFGLAFLQNATSEAAQELTGTVVFDRIKGILTGHDEEQARADEIFYKGEYINSKGQPVYLSSDKSIALQQARVQAAKEKFDEAKESAIGGFLGGGFGAVYGQTAQAIGTEQVKRAAGQQIMNRGVTEGMTAQEKTAKNSENVYALVQAAKQMKEGTESRALAVQIEQDIANGKGYDKRKIGSLARSVVGESGEKIGSIAKGIIRQSIKEDVQAAGLDDAEGWTDLITRAVTGEETSMMERARLAANKKASTIGLVYGSDAAMQIVKPEVHRQIMEQTKDERSVQETVLDMLRPEEDRQKEAGRYAGMMEGAETATKAEINDAGGLKTHSGLEVIRDGKVLEILKANVRTVKEDGKNVQRLELDLSDGSKAVDAATVKAANEGLAKVLRFSAAGGNRLLGANTLNTVIMRAGKTADPATLARDAVRITLDTVMGTKSRTDLDDATDTELRDAAKEDYKAAEAERVRNYRQLKPGQGKVSFAGAEYGTKEFGKALQQLNRTQRNEADAIGKIAKAAGFTVNLIYDPENVKEQGSYSTEDGITVNLAGEAYGGKHRSALATLAHEMTHWLEGNSQADYAKLRSFVMNNMQRSRYDVEGELQGIMANYARNGVELDLNGAMAEMIAKSAEEILTNEKVIRQLKESDPGLHGNIQRIVSDMVGRIQVALGQIKLSSSRYAQGMREYADKMSDLWLATYEEAKGVKGTGVITGEKYALDTYDNHTLENWKKSKRIVIYTGRESLENFYNDSIANKINKSLYFGKIGKSLATFVKNKTGVDTEGLNVALYSDEVRKVKKRHGDATKEALNGQVPITANEMEDIIRVIGDPDDVKYAGMRNGSPVLNFVKNINGEQTTVTYIIPDKHDLRVQTVYKHKQNNKSLAPVNYATSAQSPLTSNNARGTAPANIIQNQNSNGKTQSSIQDEMDAAYEDAVRRGDWRAAEDMLLEKAQRTEGITGYKAPHFYNGEHQDIAKEIKKNYGNAVARAVEDMAPMIPQNAVLIPMPPHTGVVTDDTDTMILAKALGEATGMPVVNALESDYHTSRYKAKAAGDRSVNANTMGFRQVAEIPEGAMPVFVDNMVGGGQTAMAAKNAIGRGITLAYAQSGRSKSQGVKALTVTYDKDGKLIPLSQRMDPNNSSWKYSIEDDGTEILDEDGNKIAKVLPGGTVTQYSLQSWEEDSQKQIMKNLIKVGYDRDDVTKWLADVNEIAKIIAEDRARLDYKADRDQRYLKKNSDVYKYTLDASTLCAKRLLYQGTFNAIQALLPNTPLRPGDLIDLANMMHEMGFQTPCGICYVESRRRHTGNAAEQFLQSYKGEYIPKIAELTSTDGLAKLKEEHPQAYKDFIKAMNKRGSGSVKIVQQRTDYRKDVRRMSKDMVDYLNSVGGLRIQSFSDFETPHLIDMMQALLDMTAKGLKSQAYTKVPNFAWVFGDTGIKINLSLMGEGTGVDSKGRLIFSDTEGMKFSDAMKLRNRYSKNVGTILVGMNDAHIIAAMGDNRIDFIIPFHKSGWSAEELSKMKTLENYDNYEEYQNERLIVGRHGNGYETVKTEDGNIDPISYWDYNKTGSENSQRYLEICAERGLQPKFYNFLVDNGDGTYSLPTGDDTRSRNIREGYWKTLIDFKMYDNDGVGAPQQVVSPNVNMEEAVRVLSEYEGGANTLPVADPVVERYVREYKAKHPDVRQFSIQDDDDQNIRHWMMSVKRDSLQTEAEKVLLDNFKNLDMRIDLKNRDIQNLRERIRLLNDRGEENLDADEKKQLQNLRIRLENAIKVRDQAEQELGKIVSSEGYGRMMKNQQRIYEDFMQGKTQQEVTETIGQLQKYVEKITGEIEENRKRAEEIEGNGIIAQVQRILGSTNADKVAGDLKKEFQSTWTKAQIRNYLDPILLKMANGEDFTDDVQTLAGILIENDKRNTYEGLSALRGLTITLGKGQQKELKAQHGSLKEIRSRLAGTGITVKYGDHSTLESDIEDLRAEFPNMPDFGNEKDALENFVSWVEGMKRQDGIEFYDETLAQTMATIMEKAAAAAKVYIPSDAKARQQVLDLVEFVKGLNAETTNAVQALQRVAGALGEISRAGNKAAGLSNVLLQHIDEALEYYDRTAKIAVATARRDRNNQIVEQLKSEHAQKIAKNNEEWRNLIERDRQARLQTEDNRKYRNRINTAMKRTYDLLKNPQGLKNIPEYMQGLARELLETIVDNDLSETRRTKLTQADRKQLDEAKRLLTEWKKQNGEFNIADVYEAEEAVALTMDMDLQAIRDGIEQLNREIRGKNRLDSLQQRGEILQNIQEAVGEIYTAIRRENEIQVNKRRVTAEDQAYRVANSMHGKRATEYTGKAGRVIKMLHKGIVSGNMTPEYYFRTLGNAGLSELWENYHAAENRNGLELRKAQEKLAEIADKHGYSKWDMQQKITVPLASGDVEMTLGQIMSLWATWKRENTLGPQMSEHLTKGGFYAEKDTQNGILGKTVMDKRAHRITATDKETGINPDMDKVRAMLTEEQLQFIDDVVEYMSTDMSELGNEASMAAYGIKMYKEKYYYPFQMWNGIKSMKSNDAGNSANIDRAFHPSFSKTRMHGANNAIILGDFMQTAADHIAGMINYATMGLANESLQKVLNIQLDEGEGTTKRNIRTMLEEAYGSEAMQYLDELKTQLNGGAVRIDKTFYDRLISLFRKNAVAGSLSVAAQQPLSYIRAAVMVNPKYLAMAMNPGTYKGSYTEMMEHSGVAVIKEMGRFDMNAGQSAREYLLPDAKKTKWQQARDEIAEKATILPELMDRMTWTRIWTAVKLEQEAQHPDMDHKSDEFLDMVGERFNDVMRRTQVYDSVLVKSQNMRNQNPGVKMITSFMAEPTLTVNVLADAVRSAVNKEQGSKALLASAGATFLLSAAVQAAVKGAFGAGRNPDEKKNGVENFLYRFWSSFISEVDPLTLIPGYSTAIDLMKGSDISDNALGAVQKIFDAGKTGIDALLGNNSRGAWRDIEDSVGQILQIFSRLPAKNLMRDARAMYNWITGAFEQTSPYAWRPTDNAVLKYQAKDLFYTADNLWGVVNQWLGEAGYQTDKNAYYRRVYEAMKQGKEQEKNDLISYLLHGKGVKEEKTITNAVNNLAKADESLTPAARADFLAGNGYGQMASLIKGMYEDGEIDRKTAEKLYAEKVTTSKGEKPDKKAIAKALDGIDYKAAGGDADNFNNYTMLYEAVDADKKTEAASQIKKLKELGYEESGIRADIKGHITSQYKEGKISKTQAENRLKAYCPELDANEAWYTLDRIDYKKETGKDAGSGKYYRLWYAMDENKGADITSALKGMIDHGVLAKNIKSQIGDHYKQAYLSGSNNEKVKIKDAIEKAYKALGLTVAEADKLINGWTKTTKKKKK